MPKCLNDCNTPKVLEIHNHECPVLFHKVVVPAAIGDDETNPPRNGQYRNVLLVYEANGHVYLFSSDGIPTFISDGGSGTIDYEELENKPLINGHELVGDSSLEDIGVDDAINDALVDYTPTDELAAVALSGDYDDLLNKPTIPVVNDATLTIKRNNESVGTFTANSATNTDINITVPVTAADVHALPDSTKYGSSIVMSINTTDYKVTTTLKDQDGNTLGTAQVIDLPLESVVVNGSYDSTNKKIVLTLQNGNTIDIPVGDLISGLQTEITPTNKLSADLVDDTSTTHKFTTAADISKLAGIETGAEVNVQSNWNEANSSSDAYIQNKPSIPTKTSDLTNDGADNTSTYVEADELATVATSGSYSDLINKPTIPTVNDATLTIQRNSTTVGTFTANASQGATVDITVPTKTSDLNNDSGFITSASLPTKTSELTNDGSDGTSTYVEADELATVATTGAYSDLTGTPTIPTVNDATLTIQRNSVNVDTFTANASQNKTINIAVPTATSDLNNDSGFLTATDYASANTGGVIKVGNNLAIDANGVLSATDTTYSAGTNISISNDTINTTAAKVTFREWS